MKKEMKKIQNKKKEDERNQNQNKNKEIKIIEEKFQEKSQKKKEKEEEKKEEKIKNISTLIEAKWLFISNILQKLFTFGINQIIIRSSGPEIFGIAAVQLELLLSTLLFLSREGIRLALIRTVIGDSKKLKQQMVNISWIPSILITLATIFLYIYCPSDIVGMSREVLLLYCFGALFESFGESWLNLYNNSFELSYRARADTVAVITKSLSTYFFVVHQNMGVKGFGYAQAIYGLSHFLTLVFPTINNFFDFLPSFNLTLLKSLSIDNLFGKETSFIALQLTGNSLLKHFLTQGDKIILSISANHFHQGVFAVTSNYGSLIARLLFQPLEESCRISFSQTSGSITLLSETKDSSKIIERNFLLTSFRDYVCKLLKMMILFGSIFPIFGSAYSRLLVKIILGSRWYSEETVSTISIYCYYLIIMGINGISEAFIQGVANTSLFGIMNLSLFSSSIVFYIIVQPLTSYYGTSGVILANIFSMMIRIIFNFYFIKTYFLKSFKDFSLFKNICPSIIEIIFSGVIYGIVMFSSKKYATSEMSMKDAIIHLLIGGVCGVVFLGFLVMNQFSNLKSLISNRSIKQD